MASGTKIGAQMAAIEYNVRKSRKNSKGLSIEELLLLKMKYPLLKIVLIWALTAVFAALISAQNGSKSDVKPVPFADGEILTFEGKVSKNIIRGIAIADLTFTVAQRSSDDYLVKADARSKGTLLKLFRYSFLYENESVIGEREFRIKKTTKHDVQKERVRDSEALFDYKEGLVTYVETDPKEPMRPPRKIASDIASPTHDLVSGLY
ncbi:MAG: hypothetical protein ABIU09_11220, partial [Pyrinomonadaceae bacterium]